MPNVRSFFFSMVKPQNLVRLILVLFLPLLVIVINPLAVEPVLVPRMLFTTIIGLALAILMLLIKLKSTVNVKLHKYWVTIGLAYLAVTLYSVSYTVSLSEGIFDLNRSLLMATMLALIALLLAIDKHLKHYLIWGVWTSAWLLLLWGGVELIMVIPSLSVESVELYKVTATMAHKNLLASAYLLLIPFVLFMFLTQRTYLKFSSFLLLVGMVLMILMLQGRSSWVAFAAMLVVGLLFVVKAMVHGFKPMQRLNKSDKAYIAVMCLAILLMLGGLAVKKPDTFNYMLRKVSSMTDQSGGRDQNKETIHERYALWDNTWQLIKEDPLQGVGAGSWKLLYPKYGLEGLRSEDGYTLFQRPHNDLLWVWAELGVIGLVAYIAIFLLPLFWLFVRFGKLKKDGDRLLATCAALTIVGFFVVGLFSFPRERIFHNLLLFIAFAIVMDSTAKGVQVGRVRILVSILLVSFTWVGVASFYRAKGDMHTLLVHASYGKPGQQQTMLLEAEKAKSFFYTMDPMATPMNWFQGIAYYQQGNYEGAKRHFQNGLIENPYHLHLLNNLGSTYEKLGQRNLAIVTYRKVLNVSPKYTEGLLNLSAVYFNSGQLDSAYTTIDKCSITTDHANYQIYLNAILKAKLNAMIQSSEDKKQQNALIQLMQNETALVPLYRDAKAANISFEAIVSVKAKEVY